jgi:glucose-6-phosphate isomerase
VIKEEIEKKNNIQSKYLDKILINKLLKNFYKIEKKILEDIDNPTKTLNVLNKNYKFNFKLRDLNKFKKFKKIAIIGMGGSILGTEAIYFFLKDKIKKDIYFFDDLDPKKNLLFKKKEKLSEVLFIIISKSGNTVETISNFLSLNIIKKNSKNLIIVSERSNNSLFLISKKFNLFYIEHKKNIGGRYSVLSEVGIIPAYLMGLNIKKIRSSSSSILSGKKKLFLKDSTVKLANLFNDQKIKNLIFLNYSPELKNLLLWCQQLIAESLGKQKKGFLPTISTVPRDHHSLLQLYLDGPRDKLFYIFSTEFKSKEKVDTKKIFNSKHFLNKKSLYKIKNAQKEALIKTLKNNNIPFREFKIKKTNEMSIGELFSYFILETIITGKLVKINPFDQPAVEQVKVLTKQSLT